MDCSLVCPGCAAFWQPIFSVTVQLGGQVEAASADDSFYEYGPLGTVRVMRLGRRQAAPAYALSSMCTQSADGTVSKSNKVP